MPATHEGHLLFTKWLEHCHPQIGPKLGDCTQHFNIDNPLEVELDSEFAAGDIVLIGFTPRLTGAALECPSLDPQWVTLLQKGATYSEVDNSHVIDLTREE